IMQGMEIARRLPMVAVLAWAMLLGSAMDAAFAWATVGPPVMEWRAGYIFGIAWLGLAGSVVTFPLYFRLIQRIGAGRAAYTSVLIPVIAMLISTLVEGYRWTTLAAFGALLAVAGMAIALRAKAA
ncbi:MAG TPA: DMT family transporter, partial [Sphingobium sp.]